MRISIHSILWIAVVFYPTLINPIYHLPPTTWDVYQNNFNILQAISETPSKLFHRDLPDIEDPLCPCSLCRGRRHRFSLQSNKRRRLWRGLELYYVDGWIGYRRRSRMWCWTESACFPRTVASAFSYSQPVLLWSRYSGSTGEVLFSNRCQGVAWGP